MRSALLICWITLLSTTVAAQDFASRFLKEYEGDANLNCVIVSPKMMEEVLKLDVDKDNKMIEIIAKLKSMQIITSTTNVDQYYKKALSILDQNSNRFESFLPSKDSSEQYRIMIRKKKGIIIELVMLSVEEKNFIVINFTGTMNDSLINELANSMKLKRS